MKTCLVPIAISFPGNVTSIVSAANASANAAASSLSLTVWMASLNWSRTSFASDPITGRSSAETSFIPRNASVIGPFLPK